MLTRVKIDLHDIFCMRLLGATKVLSDNPGLIGTC